MRNVRNTAVVVLAFVLLLGYVYFFERGEQVTSEELARRIFSLEEDQIEEVVLTSGDQRIVLDRPEGKWRIAEPGPFAADEAAVNGMIGLLAQLEAERVLGEADKGLEKYGLESPAYTVEIKLKDGSSRTLYMGSKTPVAGGNYAAAEGKKTVYTLSSYDALQLKKEVSDLRDKRIVSFGADEVTEIAVSGSVNVKLRKGSDQWKIESPYSDLADTFEVTDIISDVRYLRAEEFIDDSPDEEVLRDYGLADPRLTVLFTLGEGAEARQVGVIVGKEQGEDGFYLKRTDAPSVCLVKEDSFGLLDVTLNDLLNKDLFVFDHKLVRTFRYESGQVSATIERRQSDNESQWLVNGAQVDESEVLSVWADLRALDATTRLGEKELGDEYGLDEPDLTVTLELESGEIMSVFGRRRSDAVYVRVDGRSGIYAVEPDSVKALEEEMLKLMSGEEKEAE